MSEVQTRPSAPRGRSSARGGRASFGTRGGRGGRGHATNDDKTENDTATSMDDSPEIIELKKQYGGKVSTVKDMFPGWTDTDVVLALQETDGDLELTVERIADGTTAQWGEVSNTKKDRSRSKAIKETSSAALGDSTNTARAPRGARGTQDSARGGRGRGGERGRGARGRGAAVTQTNGTRTKEAGDLSVPTEEAWSTTKKDEPETTAESQPAETWGETAVSVATTATAAVTSAASSIIPDGAKKSWASMFKAVPVPEKKSAPVEKAPEPTPAPEPVEKIEDEEKPVEAVPEASVHEETSFVTQPIVPEPEAAITPSKDELTETNVEQLPDTSIPVTTETAASTAASSWDPRAGATNPTPYSALQTQTPQSSRPPVSGFVASAQKATGTPGRIPSFQRRILDQEEAVRMPGNREVDRTAVQFGAFNLGDEDVDGDREEPETRTQPPQHSPVAHPRASLPPAPAQPAGLPASLPSPKDAPGLPAAPAAAPGLPSPQTLPGSQNMAQQGSQSQYGQYGRYGQSGSQPEPSFGGKPYDPFSQQAPSTQSQFEGYPGQQGQSQSQQQSSAFSSAPSDFSSYYTADQQRNAYAQYYGQQYGQQGAQSQEGQASQQRSGSGYNAPSTEASSQYPQSSAAPASSRYNTAGEANNSGNNTPNPSAPGQQASQTSQSQQGHLSQPQQGGPGQYPYGHPYYSSPYYSAYMNQYQQGYGQGGYGGPYGKGGMYNQPHAYGMSPQTPYDHAASPAAGGFGQSSAGRDSSLGDYGRGGSQQSSQALGASSSFGAGMNDTFGRNTSYQGQGQHYAQQGSQQGGDDLKPYSEGKPANGPSPLLSQAARPGSAANSAPGQSALPPPQSSQQGYGGYPSHLQHGLHGSQTGSQYGGLGGAGGHQSGSHQNSQYGQYGQGFGGSNYYGGSQQRGGWGNNYGH